MPVAGRFYRMSQFFIRVRNSFRIQPLGLQLVYHADLPLFLNLFKKNQSRDWSVHESIILEFIVNGRWGCTLMYMVMKLRSPWSIVRLEKSSVATLLKKSQTFCRTRRFITMLTRDLIWSLFIAKWTRSIALFAISLRSTSILSSHLCVGHSNCLFPSGLPAKQCMHSSSPGWVLHAMSVSCSLNLSF
jgi:hypothetical protein